MDADVIVIGGGLAGLTAALRAAELGLRAIVLERGEGERYPCNSRQSGGIVHVCFYDVKRPPAELLAFIRKATSDEVSLPLAQAVAEDAGRLLDWLQQQGARFMRFSPLEAYRWCMAPPRAMVAGADWEGRGPDVTLQRMAGRLRELGGTIALGTTAQRLVMTAGRCTGVVAVQNGVERSFGAAAVVIADGGFQSDPELFRENIGPQFDKVLQRGARTGRGDGLRMAQAAGAKLTRRDRFYGHLLCRDAMHKDKVWPYPELDAIAVAGIVVGADGRRITDEGQGGIAIANALGRSADPMGAVAIFDAAIWDGPGTSARIPANPLLERAGGSVHRADSLEALAARLGMPPEAFAATIADYNAALDAGTLDRLAPPRSTTSSIKPMPIRTAPFMAIALCPGITYTMGGIAIDGQARVLREDDTPIPGLYAAGATTGGLEGGGRVAYVGGLIKAGVFGLRAAEQIARDVPGRTVAKAAAVDRFPTLKLIVRHGPAAAYLIATLVAFMVLAIGWPALGWLALPLAAIAGGIGYIAVRSYVELVVLITEMLLPQ